MERIDLDILNNNVIEKCLWFTTISHPLREDCQLSLMLLKGKDEKIFLLVADCKTPTIKITEESFGYYIRTPEKEVILSIKALVNNDNIILSIFDLTYPKPKNMTQKEIEAILGYPINIVK
jgi:hypothetical protein